MAAALARCRKFHRDAAGRKHFSTGEACELVARLDCKAARFDAGRGAWRDAKAQDRRQPHLALAVFRSTQDHLQKKVCARRNKNELTSRWRADAGFESK